MGRLYRVFVILSLGSLLFFVLALWKDSNREWKVYQKSFKEMELAKAKDDAERKKINGEGYQFIQYVVADGERVDRCVMCHRGIEDPRFIDAPQPYTTHPPIPEHPFERFGCTVCHQGQGRATTYIDAHSGIKVREGTVLPGGKVAYIEELKAPLLTGHYVQSSCGSCHPGADLKEAPLLSLGKKLFQEKRCLGCHSVAGIGGKRAPELTFVGEKRNEPGWHIEHFKEPEAVSPGTSMPSFRDLSEEELKALIVFVMSLKGVPFSLMASAPLEPQALIGLVPPPPSGVEAHKIKGAIIVDGRGDDEAWKTVMPFDIQTEDGPIATLKVAYDGERAYFLASWPDATPSVSSLTWAYDGAEWKLEEGRQDGLAFFWPIGNSVKDFDQIGCGVICHDSGRFAKSKRMFTNSPDELADQWLWRPILSEAGDRLSDGYLDNTVKPDKHSAHKDDDTGLDFAARYGGIEIVENSVEDGGLKKPKFMPKDRMKQLSTLNGSEGVEIDWGRASFRAGDKLPGQIALSKIQGDSANIEGRGLWKNGFWTVEFARKLKTGSTKDAQFDDLKKAYHFGMAIFDNAEGENREKHTRSNLNALSFSSP